MEARAKPSRVHSRTVVVLVVALAWAGAMFGLAELLATSQSHARSGIAGRLSQRTSAAAEFSSLYVKDILARERQQAATWLAARQTTSLDLERATRAVGFSAAVLLDHHGRALQSVPANAGLVGRVITGAYPNLATAVAGTAAVSSVIRPAAGYVPLVALATPFPTASGRRVFSGTFDVSHTPLGAYMSHAISAPGRRLYLIDATGNVIVGTGRPLTAGQTLSQLDPRLAGAAHGHSLGSYTNARGGQVFVSSAISGTPWKIVVSVPQAELYASVDGTSRSLAWVAWASLGIAGLLLIVMGAWLLRSRTRLAALNCDLDRLARVDSLTGLRNRRAIEETLIREVSAARRHESSLSVLLVDVDHFKHINDALGHQAGDAALVAIGETLQSMLRTEDTIGRWGGEEFLAVLPHTDAAGAVVIAERLRAHVATPGPGSAEPRTAITVTIGVAAWTSGGIDDLVRRADHALYAGKAAGRNNVQVSAAEPQPKSVATSL
jgi:diguanylate cyclase (GGDEF)-like protein